MIILRMCLIVLFCQIASTSIAQEKYQIEDLKNLSLEELLDITVITASKQEEKISDIPASIKIVTKYDIDHYGYQSIEEIISSITGYFVTDERGQTGSSLGVRGFWSANSQHVIVMVNGIRQINNVNDGYSLNFINIPIESIEKVEVIRGPMSVIYGAGAFYGAINIITDSEFNDGGRLSITYGNKNQRKLFYNTSKSTDGLDINFNLSAEKHDGEDIKYNDLRDNPFTGPDVNHPLFLVDRESLEGMSTGPLSFSGDKVYMNTIGKIDDYYFDLTFSKINKGFTTVVLPFPDHIQNQEIIDSKVKIGWKKKYNEKLSSDFKFIHQTRISNMEFSLLSTNDYGPSQDNNSYYETGVDFFYNEDNISLATGGFYKNIYKNINSFDADPLFGVDFTNMIRYLQEGDNQENFGGYFQLKYDLNDQLSFFGGIRLDKYLGYTVIKRNDYTNNPLEKNILSLEGEVPDTKLQILPRAAMIYSINDNNFLKFLYGRANSRPSIATTSSILSSNYINNINVPYPKPENIQTFEVNYLGNINSWLNVNSSMFYNKLDNMIIRQYTIEDGRFLTSFQNKGEITTIGTELEIQIRPNEKFGFSGEISLQDSENKDQPNIELHNSPKVLGNLKGYYLFGNLTEDKFHTSLSSSIRYIDGMETYWDNGMHPNSTTADPNDPAFIPNGRVGLATDPYTQLNVNIRMENFFNENMFLNISFSNLLDSQFHSPASSENPIFQKGMVGSSRSILATFGIDLK